MKRTDFYTKKGFNIFPGSSRLIKMSDIRSRMIQFLRSPTGLGALLVPAAVPLALGAAGLLPMALALPAGLVLAPLSFLLLAMSPLGARAMIREAERARAVEDQEKLRRVAAARRSLSLVRVEDDSVKKAIAAVSLQAGRYLEAVQRGLARDPGVENKVLETLELLIDWQRAGDHRPEPNGTAGEWSELSARMISSLNKTAGDLEAALSFTAGYDALVEKQSVREELE